MFQLSSIVQKAQTLIDAANILPGSPSSQARPSKAELFRQQYRLPDSQSPLQEINAELVLPILDPYSDHPKPRNRYEGRVHLSQHFLCFSTQYTSFAPVASFAASSAFMGQTGGNGPFGHGFTLPLCAVRKVERLKSTDYIFSLEITTWNGALINQAAGGAKKSQPSSPSTLPQKFTLHLIGSQQTCERFCDVLKKGLREEIRGVENLRTVIAGSYSEHLMLHGPRPVSREEKKAARGGPDTGLGLLYRYPGDARKLKDPNKIRLWHNYFLESGRNATLIREPLFHRLIRVGLPNRLRGEIWELVSGSFYLRLQSPHLYEETLANFSGRESLAIDEIEKDLNRSLPEYPGFQSEEGIGRLRRVLTAYSWINQEVGYCQAMNIVVAALLIYMSEAQAFFVLSVLCSRLVPGYYSTTMYGTLLDQKVFESLVEKTMPILWEHLVKSDVQLSVVSLPWFLSLYINSMPLVFAFRILDVFFLEGPKTLFQFGLAILRLNGEELLNVTDDGSFISVLKSYFSRLHESAHPHSESPKLHAITRFQVLMVVALNEFSGITHETIVEERAKYKNQVLENIESFAKRTSIRNLGPESKQLSTDDLGAIYDRFHEVLYNRQQQVKKAEADKKRNEQEKQRQQQQKQDPRRASLRRYSNALEAPSNEVNRIGLGPLPTHMDYTGFRQFLALTAKWALADSPSPSSTDLKAGGGRYGSIARSFGFAEKSVVQPADHEFMQRLFRRWDTEDSGSLSMQNIVNGLARLVGSGKDIMNTIQYFFDLYDEDGSGRIDREGILRISEALLFLSRRGFDGAIQEHDHAVLSHSERQHGGTAEMSVEERFLNSVSDFIRRCFEYADPSRSDNGSEDENEKEKEGEGDSEKDTEKEKKEQGQAAAVEATQAQLNAFSIGEDSDSGDLLELDEDEDEDEDYEKVKSPATTKPDSSPQAPTSAPTSAPAPAPTPTPTRKDSTAAANAALDPDHPLHITLPTFRMVILADELLEQFFDHFLPESFHLSSHKPADAATSTSANSLSHNLTTFANIGHQQQPVRPGGGNAAHQQQAGARGPAGVFPPGFTGLRGVLDTVVSDGMRVASEVKKRMDEAQRTAAGGGGGKGTAAASRKDGEDEEEEEEEEEEEYDELGRRAGARETSESTRQADLALLEGAEVSGRYKERSEESSSLLPAGDASSSAEKPSSQTETQDNSGGGSTQTQAQSQSQSQSQPSQPAQPGERKPSNASSIHQRIVEFET